MQTPSRRHLITAGPLAGAAASLPRAARAQADTRPVLTIAVQQILSSNTLEPLREQSNVGTRIANFYLESMIEQNLQGNLESVPGLATEWKRIDDRVVELKLRPGVRFHNGDEMTADDVVFSFGPERMFGIGEVSARPMFTAVVGGDTKDLPPEVRAIAKRFWSDFDKVEPVDKYTVRFVNKVADVTLEGKLARTGSQIISRRAFEEAKTWLDWARRPIGTGPYRIVDFKPDNSITFDAFDAYWGGRPPVRQIRLLAVPEVAGRINGLVSGQYDFACDIPPDLIGEIEKHPRYEVVGGLITNHRLLCFDKNHPELKGLGQGRQDVVHLRTCQP